MIKLQSYMVEVLKKMTKVNYFYLNFTQKYMDFTLYITLGILIEV